MLIELWSHSLTSYNKRCGLWVLKRTLLTFQQQWRWKKNLAQLKPSLWQLQVQHVVVWWQNWWENSRDHVAESDKVRFNATMTHWAILWILTQVIVEAYWMRITTISSVHFLQGLWQIQQFHVLFFKYLLENLNSN